MTILGTRPEIIRLSRIIPLLDRFCEHVVVHTGQNFSPSLRDVFFQELSLRAPDVDLGIHEPDWSQQIGKTIAQVTDVLKTYRPDRVLILGDTNSGLSAISAARMGIPVYHMEAGNRCWDPSVPEEVNRRLIDHVSTVWLPYTTRSKENLVREGLPTNRIFVTGNPIYEVLNYYRPDIESRSILTTLELQPQRFLLASIHRAENVDRPQRLHHIVTALGAVGDAADMDVVLSLHPRTKSRLRDANDGIPGRIKVIEPTGFLDFVQLERHARCVLTDSGTVQEECSILHVPSVTIRNVTERPETIDAGSNIVAGTDTDGILAAVSLVLATGQQWEPPSEYLIPNVSHTVAKILLGEMFGGVA